jgi:hypothetical protein
VASVRLASSGRFGHWRFIPAGDAASERAAVVSVIKVAMVAAHRKKEQHMSGQFITRPEIEDLCEEELQSKFCALINDLKRTQNMQAERVFALASLETVEAELNRKRAQNSRPRPPAPKCWL